MLVTRHFETEQNHWSRKFETTFHKPTSPRMSGYDGSISTQPDWQGHYSFLPPGDNGIFGQPFEHVSSSSNDNGAAPQQRSSTAQNSSLDPHGQSSSGSLGSPRSHRVLDPLGLRQPKAEPTTQGQSSISGDSYTIKAETPLEERSIPTETSQLTLEQTPPVSVSLTEQQNLHASANASGNEEPNTGKEEDEEVVDDDDMIEGDGDGVCEGEEEPLGQPQTAAERTAARRKMKRFRLTHQQTRFLMSEFAKQPHPDAAHRERLSREIPGLSPRQVQVWFQNRRAKIKRMTADDRDRMIKMRAVPDDFDNVQALHSPYGAVHPLGTGISPPVDFGSSYTDHIMRPLLVDTMRRDNDDHLSPTGISPAFGSIGFTPSGTMGGSDILSPLSPSSNDRGYYSSHTGGPLGGSSRTNPFARQNSLDSGIQLHSQSRQHIRPLQPLSLRDTISRSRSDNLQSPLRSSMSWKDGSIGYSTYSGSSGSSGANARHGSTYQPDPVVSSAGGTLGYDTGSYSTSGLRSSTANINYSSLPQPSQTRSRLRAASATLPLGLDLRHQYRSYSSSQNLQPPSQSSTPRTAPYSTSPGYSTSFSTAPLTAPIDFSLSRTPAMRNPIQDYSIPQLSAPIAPSHDFTQGLHGNVGGSSSRTPMRDTFSGPLTLEQGQGSGNEKSEGYSPESLGRSSAGIKRKRNSFSLSQGPHATSPSQSSQPYGHTN